MKIDPIGPTLKMRLVLESNIDDLLKENPNAVKNTNVGDRIVLTASTKELQAFVLKYINDDRLFSDEITLVPKTSKTGNP